MMRRLVFGLLCGWAMAASGTPSADARFSFGALGSGPGLPGRQREIAVASDGTDFFVVWKDYRGSSDFGDIYGARVTAGGVVLDGEGIPIATLSSEQEAPSVVFYGTNFFVAWQDSRDPNLPGIYGTYVTPAG